jgi:hypothetical protein
MKPQRTSRTGRRGRSALGGLLFVALTAVLVLAVAPSAWASADLSVSYPSTPIVVKAGERTSFTLSVANVGHTPFSVQVVNRHVILLQNGQEQFGTQPDPTFAGRIHVSPQTLLLPGRREKQVTITVDVPGDLRSDDYFLGFLVSPVVTSSQVRAVNSVGALVVLNVPGSRAPKLTAHFVGLPHISFGGSVKGFVRAKSTGVTTVQFTTDTQVTGFVSPRPNVLIDQAHLLPAGLTWDVPVHFSSWLGLGWYTIRATLVYNATPQSTAQVVLSRTIIMISLIWLLVPAALVAIVAFFVIRRVRRKRRRRRQALAT